MHEIKTMIKKTANYFGFEILRYTPIKNNTPLFNRWLTNLQRTDPVRVVFDVGANQGQTADLFRWKWANAMFIGND